MIPNVSNLLQQHLLLLLLSAATLTDGFSTATCCDVGPSSLGSYRIGGGIATRSPFSLSSSTFSSASTSSRLQVTTALGEDSGIERVPFPMVLWRFTRPHTLIGSALAIPALHMLAAPSYKAAVSMPNVVAALYAMVPSLLMNLYITGLNQITDVEIDKINKPDLPIAAGILSSRNAIIIVTLALVTSLLCGVAHPVLGSNGLNVALWGSMILGTLYSVPPFRLKRHPLLAALCIVAVRGTIINAGFFAHARAAAFGGGATTTALGSLLRDPVCGLSSLFFAIFGIVIALMKDVPDVKGDTVANVRTFSVRVGQRKIFHAMKSLLAGLFFAYGTGFARWAATAASLSLTVPAVGRAVLALSSFVAGSRVLTRARTVDPEDPKDVYGYYMFLWKLFYLSYLGLPLAR